MKHALLSTLLLVSLAAPAAAQNQTAPPPMIKTTGLPTVFLTDRQGKEHRGKLIRVAADEVVLLGAAGERTFARDEVAQIEKRGDSLKNGAIIGAAVGAVAGFFGAGLSDCPGAKQSCAGARVTFFTIAVATYAAIGTGIDALIQGRTVLYRAHGTGTVTFAAQPGRAAVGLKFQW